MASSGWGGRREKTFHEAFNPFDKLRAGLVPVFARPERSGTMALDVAAIWVPARGIEKDEG
jgi:hypothetical protein